MTYYILLYLELRLWRWRLFRQHRNHVPGHRIPQGRHAHRYVTGDEPRFNEYADAAYFVRTAVAS